MQYKSTRNSDNIVTASQAILQGLASDGGLYVPCEFPQFDNNWAKLKDYTYQEMAYYVLQPFLSDFSKEQLNYCINQAYDDKFDTKEIAPLVKVGDSYHLELFHGSTIAFKDMALSILPHLLKTSAKINNNDNEIIILTATSGDTGKAAMAGFSNVEGTKIIVFYPDGGVSSIQERQMLTQTGDNTYVVAIEGNFDDAQSQVKKLFNDQDLRQELASNNKQFSSANSMNIGRLLPQVVYYYYSYAQLVKKSVITPGQEINVSVPTGNFGNILAAYYAKRTGLPIAKLICASNENKVLYDFFQSGSYDTKRPFILTNSPSMDILVSSNFERLVYHAVGESSQVTKQLMNQLEENGLYQIPDQYKNNFKDFIGQYTDEEETLAKIKRVKEENAYIMDTHTAVASSAVRKTDQNLLANNPTVVVSTASPYKFPASVLQALDIDTSQMSDQEVLDKLQEISGVDQPAAVKGLLQAPILHDRKCKVDQMRELVRQIVL